MMKYLTLEGRLPLRFFWAAWIVDMGLSKIAEMPDMSALYVLYIALLPFIVSVYVRRLHDIGWSGKWILPMWIGQALIAIAKGLAKEHLSSQGTNVALGILYTGLVIVLIALPASWKMKFSSGNVGDNKYGAPYAPPSKVALQSQA